MSRPKTKEAEKVERRTIQQVAIDMRVRGFAWDEITEVLDKEHKIKCSQFKVETLCEHFLSKTPITKANQLRMLESLRLDILVHGLMTVFLQEDVSFHDRHKAALAITKISERRCSMLGLNMQPVFITPTTQAAQETAQNITDLISGIRSQPEEPAWIQPPDDDQPGETWHDRPSVL